MNAAYTIDDTTGKATIIKDPQAVLDYPFDWTAWLTPLSDTILSVAFTLTGGGTVLRQTNSPMIAVAWISGGTAGSTLALTCKITTVGERTDERTVYLKVKDQ